MNLPGMPGNKKVGWSAHGQLIAGGGPSRLVTLQADFPQPREYTVEFNLNGIITNLPTLLTVVRAEALITWSVEGNSVTRRVTVGNGVSVTGVGQACRVVIQDVSFLAGGEIVSYQVSCQVSPGPRASTEEPPILEPLPGFDPSVKTLLPVTFFDFPVPQDAGVISVQVAVGKAGAGVTPIPDQGVLVQHLTSAPVILKEYDPRFCCWVPVSPGTTIIRVSNQSIVDAISVQCTFGIDG